MRVLLVGLLLASATLLVAAPAVEARGFCSDLVDEWCRGALCIDNNSFCTRDLNPVCVTEPCPQPIP